MCARSISFSSPHIHIHYSFIIYWSLLCRSNIWRICADFVVFSVSSFDACFYLCHVHHSIQDWSFAFIQLRISVVYYYIVCYANLVIYVVFLSISDSFEYFVVIVLLIALFFFLHYWDIMNCVIVFWIIFVCKAQIFYNTYFSFLSVSSYDWLVRSPYCLYI